MAQGNRRSAAGGGSSKPVSRKLPNSGYEVSAVWFELTVYPFLGYLRAKSRLRRLRSETRLRAQSRAHSLPARGMQHP